jgi:hypothetical protein
MNPPYMDDTDPHYAKGIGFDDKSIRVGFIRRVYSILSVSVNNNNNNFHMKTNK